jgi:hypothetical protein
VSAVERDRGWCQPPEFYMRLTAKMDNSVLRVRSSCYPETHYLSRALVMLRSVKRKKST